MKTNAAVIGMIFAGSVFAALAVDAPPKERPPVSREKASYAIGVNIGSNFKRQDVDVEPESFLKGLKDAMAGSPTMTEAEIRETLMAFQQELTAKQQEKRRLLSEKNKVEGEKFLTENKTKPGVVSLESGLQYKVITEGSGPSPGPTDIVEVNYRGTLIDGTEFDSSAKGGKPWTTPVNGVIKGWSEALTHMKAGSKWQLFVQSDLAYGEFGNGQKIGPNAALVFDIELVSFKPAPPPPPAAAPLTSDIIKVPSADEMKKGAKIETLKAEDVEKMIKDQQAKEGKAKQ